MDYSGTPNNDLPNTPVGPIDTIVLSNSASLGHSDLPGARADSVVHSEMLLTSKVPLVISSWAEVPSSQQPSVLGAFIAGGSRLPLVPSTSGKEPAMSPVVTSASESSAESDSPIQHPSLVEPAWRSRPYAQPLLVGELMTEALSLPRYMKVDQIVQQIQGWSQPLMFLRWHTIQGWSQPILGREGL